MDSKDKISFEQRQILVSLVGELTVTQGVLKQVFTELHSIELEYLRALDMPEAAAFDTVNPLPERLALAYEKAKSVLG